jgi:hypothetical protein
MLGEPTRIKKRNRKPTIKLRDFDIAIPKRGDLKKIKNIYPPKRMRDRDLLKPD